MAGTDAAGTAASAVAFLEGSELGLAIYQRVLAVVSDAEPRVTRSQIAFRRRRGFAWLWRPRTYLGAHAAEAVLSIALPRQDRSPRWKEVVQPAPGRWMHHLELANVDELDAEVDGWLLEAARTAA